MPEKKQSKNTLLVAINDYRIGGAQNLVTEVLTQLDRTQFDIHLVTFTQHNRDVPTFYDALPKDVQVHQLQFGSLINPFGWLSLFRVIKAVRPDVVWSHLFFSNTVMRILKPLCGYIVITNEHNTYRWKRWHHRYIDKVLSAVTDRIVAVSQEVKQYTATQSGIPEERFVVIHNGVDVDYYQSQVPQYRNDDTKTQLGFRADDRLIISVGQLIKQKNHELLVRAFAEFWPAHPNYKLVILGEGATRELLEGLIAELHLSDQVCLPGAVPEPVRYYANSEVFVLPSRFEGFGIVCIEAMAAGLPVLATRVAGPNEYLEDGTNGYFIEGTVRDVAQKLEMIADLDEKKLQQLQAAAHATAAAYDIKTVTKEYERLFKRALQQ